MKKTLLAILLTTVAVSAVFAGPGANAVQAISNQAFLRSTEPVTVFHNTGDNSYIGVFVAVDPTLPVGMGFGSSDTVTVTCGGKSTAVVAGSMVYCMTSSGNPTPAPNVVVQIKPENYLNGANVTVSVAAGKKTS